MLPTPKSTTMKGTTFSAKFAILLSPPRVIRAAIITRALVEMKRLAVAMGAKEETINGLTVAHQYDGISFINKKGTIDT